MSTVLHPEVNEATSDTTWLGYHLQSPSPGTVTLHPGTIPGGEHGRITCKVLNELIYMDHQLYRLLCETPTYASISSNLKKKQTQGGYINGFQLRKVLLPREYVALLRDIFKCHNLG